MTKELLCTLGPTSMNERVIRRLSDLGATLFRINLSHTAISDLPEAISFIRRYSEVPICLDTEGAQVRNGPLQHGCTDLVENSVIVATQFPSVDNDEGFNFYPDCVIGLLEIGDLISIDFNSVLVQVIDKHSNFVKLRVINGGRMGQNKAVTVDRPLALPPLTNKDRLAIEIGKAMGVRDYALSFANRGSDVELMRDICGGSARIISKIECRNGLINMAEIVERSDAILIDRGDLSREIAIERIPLVQETIIRHCNNVGRPVYVATNLLESMVHNPSPTRAEVNDVITTLSMGADGLVLAAETAVGVNPIASANMIVKLVHSFESSKNSNDFRFEYEDARSLLITPHGGKLITRYASDELQKCAIALRRISVKAETLQDCEQIAMGTYSPLSGFMDRESVISVLRNNRLPSGDIWTMPILLPIDNNTISPDIGENILLCADDGSEHSIIDVSEVFELDLNWLADTWFGTTDAAHPGVARLKAMSGRFIAGEIHLLQRYQSPFRHYELTPEQSRFIFSHKGWTRVIGFHTRNPAHRVHEFLQLQALSRYHADGIYICPVTGSKKPGDFLPGPILESYQELIKMGVYPQGRVVLGGFSTYSRFSGPREAVFTALCRKNMGCSHFIIGRDHAGVGKYYSDDEMDKYLNVVGDIGVELIKFKSIFWDSRNKVYSDAGNPENAQVISGTLIRDSLRNGVRLPDWIMRAEIQDLFLKKTSNNESIFY